VTTSGVSLGILERCVCGAGAEVAEGQAAQPKIPIEEKKTFSWNQGMRDTVEVAPQMPQTRLINVCDWEADFFELFDEQRRNPSVDLLVRAYHNRVINREPDKLFETPASS
jgi:hypothetical protein